VRIVDRMRESWLHSGGRCCGSRPCDSTSAVLDEIDDASVGASRIVLVARISRNRFESCRGPTDGLRPPSRRCECPRASGVPFGAASKLRELDQGQTLIELFHHIGVGAQRASWIRMPQLRAQPSNVLARFECKRCPGRAVMLESERSNGLFLSLSLFGAARALGQAQVLGLNFGKNSVDFGIFIRRPPGRILAIRDPSKFDDRASSIADDVCPVSGQNAQRME